MVAGFNEVFGDAVVAGLESVEVIIIHPLRFRPSMADDRRCWWICGRTLHFDEFISLVREGDFHILR